MSFGFGNAANNIQGGTAGGGAVGQGPDLEVIQTEAIGFLSIAGDAKIRLSSPWPSDSLPAPTASLLSVASRRGLVAAAGPDAVILATAESVRKAFEATKDGDLDVRPFEPQMRLPMPARVSQLAFSADENLLLLSAESGGGLAVYDVEVLLQGGGGNTQPAFEVGTNREAVRSLIPNPTRDKAELCAVVTTEGNLHVANMRLRQLGPLLRPQVSCVSWSNKGKQLVAGLADGNIIQMTPEGEVKAEIPKPPNAGDAHVSSLSWLENNLFLAIHTSNNQSPPVATYSVITRQPPSAYSYRKLSDPVDPFGSERLPHHSLLRLKEFAPNLQDLLIVASTASTDVGLLTRSKAPLASDKPAESITGLFTTTELSDDTKRATMPMTASYEDSIPIGIALDLSSKETVYKPIPTDEMEESPGPLPAFWLLTHEGVLCVWWIVYVDSIRQGLTYQSMTVVEGSAPEATTTPSRSSTALPFAAASGSTPAAAAMPSAFGSGNAPATAFGGASSLGPRQSPWGSNVSATVNTGGAVFGSTSTFGAAPAQSASGPSFGQSGFAARSSPWAPASASSATPASGTQSSGFGALGGGSSGGQSIFGSSAAAPPSGGFANFASKGGFGALAGGSSNGSNAFGGKPARSVFGSGGDFAMDTDTSFPTPQDQEKPRSNLLPTPFKLDSTFKPDPNDGNDVTRPSGAGASGGGSLFGSGFGNALGEAANEETRPNVVDDDMGAEASAATPQPVRTIFEMPASTTPTTQPGSSSLFGPQKAEPASPKSLFGPTSKPPGGGLFAAAPSSSSTLFGPKAAQPVPDSSPFGQRLPTEPPRGSALSGSSASAKPAQADPPFGSASKSHSGFNVKSADALTSPGDGPKSKTEGEDKSLAQAPLPPESTSKATYALGDSGSSSAASSSSTPKKNGSPVLSDAPLPPDFITPKPAKSNTAADAAPLPPDFLPDQGAKTTASLPSGPSETPPKSAKGPRSPDSSPEMQAAAAATPIPIEPADDRDDFSEGSGVDVAKEFSQSSVRGGSSPASGMTPGSSFVSHAAERPRPPPLFGEISRQAPVFPQPVVGESPRSPSPIRGSILTRGVRGEVSRSVSAPGMASQLLGARKSQRWVEQPLADPLGRQHREAQARKEMGEMQPLVDEGDEEVHQLLASEAEPTLELDEFVAHATIVPPAKDGIPAQVEAVYRDVNSMIDTLGLNTRSLSAFVKGHTVYAKADDRTVDDLEDPDGWVLSELSELTRIICSDLAADLDGNQVRDLNGKLNTCQDLTRDMSRLRAKQTEIKRLMAARTDPVQAEMSRTLPLSAEQAAQQADLRKAYAEFARTLAEAEEALTMLRTKIASSVAAAGGGGGSGGAGTSTQVPTVDAVVRTISKMTGIAEKRSGDVDVLENQIRKLRIAGSSVGGGGSRDGSPALTTPRKGTAGALATMSVMSPETPPSGRRSGLWHRHPLTSSTGVSPARRTMGGSGTSGFSAEEKMELMKRRAKRQGVLARLEAVVVNNGVNVKEMEVME